MGLAKWQDSYVNRITRCIKEHDSALYAARDENGVVHLFKRSKAYVPVMEDEGISVKALVDSPQYVLSLTETWSQRSLPREWGSLVILEKLNKLDPSRIARYFQELEEDEEKSEKSLKRESLNRAENAAREIYPRFKKAMSDTRVANMDLKKDARRLRDKSIK